MGNVKYNKEVDSLYIFFSYLVLFFSGSFGKNTILHPLDTSFTEAYYVPVRVTWCDAGNPLDTSVMEAYHVPVRVTQWVTLTK